MINKDRIFNLFSTTPEVKEKEEKRISIEEYIESPYAKIGMFTKLILNHFVFQEKFPSFIKNSVISSLFCISGKIKKVFKNRRTCL